jgi:DNA-binding winged helix-turn-helix (wHTH) protein
VSSVAAAISIGPLSLDVAKRRLTGGGGDVELTPLVARFLETLAIEPGSVVTRERLIDRLWAGNHLIGEPALNRVASETRLAIRKAGGEPVIETVQRRGYRLIMAREEDRHSRAPSIRTLAIATVLFLLLAGALNWLMETAMGLIWLSGQAN